MFYKGFVTNIEENGWCRMAAMEQVHTVWQLKKGLIMRRGKNEVGQLCPTPCVIRIIAVFMRFPLHHGLLRVSEKQGTSSLHRSTLAFSVRLYGFQPFAISLPFQVL